MKNLKGGTGPSTQLIIPNVNKSFVTYSDTKYVNSVNYKENEKEKNRENNKKKPTEGPMSDTVVFNVKKFSTDNPPQPQQIQYIYPDNMVNIPKTLEPISTNFRTPWGDKEYKLPIVNKYNINIQGFTGDIKSVANIFEDILPESNVGNNRMTSLQERKTLHSYVRSILIRKGDGEEVSLNGKKIELLNLLSYMKIVEINPYHNSRITNNIIKTIPENFIMFKSCYPIRKSNAIDNIVCATDSLGSNIRVYSMSVYDELSNLINDRFMLKVYSDTWREIMFYTYVREELLKKNVCPHFVFMHSYYIAENNSINFNKLKHITKDKSIPVAQKKANKKRNTQFKNFVNPPPRTLGSVGTPPPIIYNPNMENTTIIKFDDEDKLTSIDLYDNQYIKIDDENHVNINERSLKCAVAITEAPDQNIIEWSSRTYTVVNGPIKRQLTSGVHTEMTWKSILFQMLYTFITMYSHKICIMEFKWHKNIYVKNFVDTGSIGFWNYKINDINFYVPNMKSLILIDSCFDKIKDGMDDKFDHNVKFKIKADFLSKSVSTILPDIRGPNNDDFKEMSKQFFDINVFTDFHLYGGIEPEQSIKNLMREINVEIIKVLSYTGRQVDNINFDLCMILYEKFDFFLHNKIGSVVEQTDKQQLYNRGVDINKCKVGDMIAYEPLDYADNVPRWAIYVKNHTNGTSDILTKNPNANVTNITNNNIYRLYGTISQTYKIDSKITSMDELLETYSLYF